MSSDFRIPNDAADGVTLPEAVPRQGGARGLSLQEPAKPVREQRSSDPYNTSGSFDRTKNWARVGKR
jgi:hypothetical protein